MCSFSISEPVTTDKITYVSCQSKSNFSSRLSVLLTVKPPILFFALRWFFGVAHRKTTDTFYRKFFESFIGFVNGKTTDTFFLPCGGFSVSLTVKPPILFMGNLGSVILWCRSPQNHRYFL